MKKSIDLSEIFPVDNLEILQSYLIQLRFKISSGLDVSLADIDNLICFTEEWSRDKKSLQDQINKIATILGEMIPSQF